MTKEPKQDLIDALNDRLDSLTGIEAAQIFSRLRMTDLMKLDMALDRLIADIRSEAARDPDQE